MADTKSIRWWNFLAGWGPLVAFAPVFVFEIISVWFNRPTRIAVLAIPLLLVTLFIRFQRERTDLRARQWWSYGLLASGVLLGIFSGFFVSIPFFLWGGLLCLTAWLIAESSSALWPKIAGHVGLLAVACPWPFNLINVLGSMLQRGSAKILSTMMDGLQIFHIRTNSLFEQTGLQFTIDDRLHGIDGLLPLVLIGGTLAIVRSRSFSHALTLMLSSVLWLVIGYVSYGLIVSFCFDRYQWDLGNGTGSRYGLGVGILLTQIVLLYLSDIVLARLTEKVPTRSLSSDIAITPTLLNGLLTWPQVEEEEYFDADPEDGEKSVTSPSVAETDEVAETVEEEYWAPADWNWRSNYRYAIATEALLISVGLLFIASLLLRQSLTIQVRSSDAIVQRLPEEKGMPRVLGNMKLVGYGDEKSDKKEKGEGLYQRTWKYQDESQTGTITLSYPITESDLWNWKIEGLGLTRRAIEYSADSTSKGAGKENNWSWMLQHGDDDDQGNVYVWRSALKEDLTPVRHSASSALGDRLYRRMKLNVVNELFFKNEQNAIIGFIVILETTESLDKAGRSAAQEWFGTARNALRTSVDRPSNTTPTSN